MGRFSFSRATIAVALVLMPAVGQAQEQERPKTETIVVETDRAHSPKAVKALARAVGGDISVFRPIARFGAPLCLDVVGLKDEHTPAFTQRVYDNARRAGVRIGDENCRPNALISFANDSLRQLKDLRKQNRYLFGEMPASEFRTLLASRDGVYAWKINEVIGIGGMPMNEINEFGYGVAVNRNIEVGRLNPPIRIVTNSSVVVIDRSRVGEKSIEQLADYATMRLIAPTSELPEQAPSGPSTIMTLFSNPANAPAEMTAFDRAFLESVYDIRANGPSAFVFAETAKALAAQPVSEAGAP